MPWVRNEPLILLQRAEKISGWVADRDAAGDFTFALADSAGELLGVRGLHRCMGAPDGREFGYWVRSGRTGEGIATGADRALVQAAVCIDGISFVELHHDAANTASARVAEKAGFIRVSDEPAEPEAPGEDGIDVTWRLRHQL